MKRPVILLLPLLLPLLSMFTVAAEAAERLAGRVTARGGVAIERARVEIDGQGTVWTDADGRFVIEAACPCRVTVSHQRFVTLSIDAATAKALAIQLEPRIDVFAHVTVTAGRGGKRLAPVTGGATSVRPGDAPAPPSTLADVITTVPGVAEAGQGGIFQTYSVRGIAGQRLLTLIDGMTIIAERRAGSSGSFLDPALMGEVEVLRGPAGTLYGSGALGGVVQVVPRRFEGWDLAAGYETTGDQHFASAGWGGNGWSVGVAERRARKSESASGQELNDGFRQLSAVVSKVWTLDGIDVEAVLVPTRGRDIGKSSTDYPRRITDYPEEDHLLARVGVRREAWSASVWAHPSDLRTRVRRDNGDGSDVDNKALDFGAHAQHTRALGPRLSGVLGADLVSRRGVDAREERFENFDPSMLTVLHTLDGAASDGAAVYGTLQFTPGAHSIQGGVRALYNRQSNTGYGTTSDTGVAGFLGVKVSVGSGVALLANAGTGIRYPTLTERFFTGTTGRGGVIGNPDLDAEHATSVDAGLRWSGGRGWIEAIGFANAIDDFIEQVDAGPDLSTFVNVTEGRILGVEIDGHWQIDPRWSLRGAGARLRGRDDDGRPLTDVPAHRASMGGRLDLDEWTFRLDAEHRRPKDDPGPGEKAIPSATLVSASAVVRIGRGVTLSFHGTNLLDEAYFPAADEKAPEAHGRAASFTVAFRP